MSPDGQYLIATNPGVGTTQLLRMPLGQAVADVCAISATYACAFSLDETTLAIANPDGLTTVYDVPSCAVRSQVQFDSKKWNSSRQVFLNDNGSIVACHPTQAFDTRTSKPADALTNPSFMGHAMSEHGFRYSPDGTMAATMEDVNGVMILVIRDSRTNRQLHAIHHPNSLAGWQCWSPDGDRIAVLTANHVVVLIDPNTGHQVAELDHCSATIVTLTFTEDGQALRALTKSENGQLEWHEWRAPRDAPNEIARAK